MDHIHIGQAAIDLTHESFLTALKVRGKLSCAAIIIYYGCPQDKQVKQQPLQRHPYYGTLVMYFYDLLVSVSKFYKQIMYFIRAFSFNEDRIKKNSKLVHILVQYCFFSNLIWMYMYQLKKKLFLLKFNFHFLKKKIYLYFIL